MMDKPMVSVCMITYNHEKYIREAVEGVLMQKTNFKVELIISDDCSKDGTVEVIQQIVEENNSSINIQCFKQPKNVGMMPNFIFTLEKCEGKYIALCEGDDYWTDLLKLQKQVDLLEQNHQFSYCGHNSFNDIEGNHIPSKIQTSSKRELSFADVVESNPFNTASLVFRKEYIENLPTFFHELTAGDWGLQLIALRRGRAFVLQDYMSVYRIHKDGIWNKLTDTEKGLKGIETLNKMKILFKDRSSQNLIDYSIEKRKKKFNIKDNSELSFIYKIKSLIKKLFNG